MRDALSAWLATCFGAITIELGSFSTPDGVGHSNETTLVDATWTDTEGATHDESLVVRLEITGPGVFPTYDLGMQVACMRQIAENSDVPVPNVRGFESDPSVLGRTFFVMDRVDAVVPGDKMPYTIDGWLIEAPQQQQAELWWSSIEAMAALHRLDPLAAGFDFLDRAQYGPAGILQQFAWWQDYAGWVADGRESPTIDAAGAWLSANMPEPSGPIGLTWGDARLSNMMYRDFRPVVVLDWEMASLGPAEIDLAWFLFFQRFFSEGIGFPDLPGFPAPAETIHRYAELLGRDLDDLRWYEVFAGWRYAAVLARLADLWEASGQIPVGTGARDNNITTRMVAELLDLPSPGEPGGPFG